MPLETATYINDLDAANPPGTDQKAQGDDHLRLIKSVLKNTFKNATAPFYVPGVLSKSADYTVLSTDANKTIMCNTAGGDITLTLPTLVLGDAGWEIGVVRTTFDANTIFLVPASGAINGFTQVRRSCSAHVIRVMWSGTMWLADRPPLPPLGTIIPVYSIFQVDGTLFCDGSSFSGTDFLELATFLGGTTLPDLRERTIIGRDNLATASRVTLAACGIDGDTLGYTGGSDVHLLLTSEMPTHTHVASVTDPGHTHTQLGSTNSASAGGGIGIIQTFASGAANSPTASNTTGITVSNANAGADAPHLNMQPTIVVQYAIVAE